MTRESKTEAVRRALEERRERLALGGSSTTRQAEALRFLEREVWPQVPQELLGVGLSEEEQEEILGLGPEGV